MRCLEGGGVPEMQGHRLYAIDRASAAAADAWLHATGLGAEIDELARTQTGAGEEIFNQAVDRFLEVWQERAGSS